MVDENFHPVQKNTLDLRSKIRGRIWSFLNNTVYRYSPFYSRKFRICLVNIFGGNVDYTCSLNRKSRIDYPWNLTMKKYSSLAENSWAYCLAKIEIDEKCCIGKDVFLLTGSHDVNSLSFDLITKPIYIKKGVWVSTGSYILPGISIHDFSVIAAGAVVTKDVEAYSIIGGNPGKLIGKRQFS